MNNYFPISRLSFAASLRRTCGLALFLLIAAGSIALAQRATDGTTPLGIAPGSPAGSFALSDFDTINPYNGNLNFRLPLLNVAGRGAAQYQITLPIDQRWTVRHELFNQSYFRHYPDYNWWKPIESRYSPGALVGRQVGEGPCPPGGGVISSSLTRLTFIGADGTEYELLDQLTGGKVQSGYCPSGVGNSRGTIFVSTDGSAMTFISDTTIYDAIITSGHIYPSGYLINRDGTRSRIDGGKITWMRDRNGNRLTFTYDATHPFGRLIKITDSLNREVNIAYNVSDGQYGLHDQISYRGFGGATRTIRIAYSDLTDALRSDQTLKTFGELFSLEDYGGVYHNPRVVSSIWLPNDKRYRLYYNSYSELARVELPTGGAIEYDWGASLLNGSANGIVLVDTIFGEMQEYAPEIYRRVLTRRVYPDGGTGNTFKSRMTFGQTVGQGTATSSTVIDNYDVNGNLLTRSKHYFHGNPIPAMSSLIFEYPVWNHGREYQSETFDVVNNAPVLKQRVNNTWQPGTPISSNPNAPINPRITETVTTLTETNQVTKQTFSYDQFNNQTDIYEHAYGIGAAGALLRRTHTDYLTINPINGVNYAGNAVHIRSLPLQRQVFDANGIEKARTTYEYDNYAASGSNAPLTDRPLISGLDAAFTTGYQTRGNVTRTTRWLLPAGTQLHAHAQYDIAGNVVTTIDARGHATSFDFTDHFGSPDGDARFNSPPSELGGLSSYAFVTKATNVLGQTVYTQVDYYLGAPVDAEDINATVSSTFYNDPLGRSTQGIRVNNITALRNQTTVAYDDTNRIITVTSDLNAYGDNTLKSQTLYDGLGRQMETRIYESATAFTATKSEFDGLGRVHKTSYPFRPAEESPAWTTTEYDGLGRIKSVTTPDGAVVASAYHGAQVLVTDQAGKQRMSQTNALGQLTDVWEIRPADAATEAVSFPNHPEVTAGYRTTYSYDELNNLTTVNQGIQTRSFAYDSLSRLTSALNPETGTINYHYDNNGNLDWKADARGVKTEYTYDALNRLTNRTYSLTGAMPPNYTAPPPVQYFYDGTGMPAGVGVPAYSKGKLTAVKSAVSETIYTEFDARGRIKKHRQVSDPGTATSQTYLMEYEYDLAGNLKSQTYPSGRVITNGYDTASRINSITGQKAGETNKTYASSFSYTAHGAVKEVKLGNNLWEHAIFNNRLQPILIGLGTSQTVATPQDFNRFRADYFYGGTDNNGNVLHQTISVPDANGVYLVQMMQLYDYDKLNRLEVAREIKVGTGAQNWKQTYSYDRYGNRTFDAANTMLPTPPVNPTINPANNRYHANQGYDYDSAGDVTSAPGFVYSYDAENRMVSANDGQPSGLSTYAYDGEGRRVKKVTGSGATTTIFVYDVLDQLVAEYSTSAPAGTGGLSYLTADHLGSPRVITDANGNVKARHDYTPFGEELAHNPNLNLRSEAQGYVGDDVRQQFTGYERDDETGLDYAQARYYSSGLGRFTSGDPINTVIEERVVDPQQLNLYAYVRNNPLKFVDSTGMKINTSRLNKEQKELWDKLVELANAKDELGDYVNPELHDAYQRLNDDERTFYIENHDFGDKSGTIGEFTITKFSGNDFSEAVIQLDFKKIKNLEGPQDVDMKVPNFKKFEGLFGMDNAVVLRLAETFGHEAGHAIYALNNPAEGVKLQRLLNERDAAILALPPKTKYPYPPDVMQKMEAADKALEPGEKFAQQKEYKINRELNPKIRGSKCKKK
jgi:RHS repeat-associated protein